MPAFVGFTGARSCLRASGLARMIAAELPTHISVFVGDAAGVDAAARSVHPNTHVYHAAGSGRSALVARSIAFVRALSTAGTSPTVGRAVLFAFPAGACPPAVAPAPRWVGGHKSGTWASAALALGLGCPIVVFGVRPPSTWGEARQIKVFGFAGWLIRPPHPPPHQTQPFI